MRFPITTPRAGRISVNPNRPQYDKPRLQDALVLLASSAVCAGLFYLFTGNVTESLVYGALLGCGLAAIGAEFVKFIRSYRAEPGAGSATGAVTALVTQAFRIGFISTFATIMKELFKLLGVKIAVSIVIAASAWFAISGHSPF